MSPTINVEVYEVRSPMGSYIERPISGRALKFIFETLPPVQALPLLKLLAFTGERVPVQIPLWHLDFPRHIRKALARDNAHFIADLIQRSREEVLRAPRLGKVSVARIEAILADAGHFLNTDIPGWPGEALCDTGSDYEWSRWPTQLLK